jgi:hypothetical protein
MKLTGSAKPKLPRPLQLIPVFDRHSWSEESGPRDGEVECQERSDAAERKFGRNGPQTAGR